MRKSRPKKRSSAPRLGQTKPFDPRRYDAQRMTPDLLETYHPPKQRALALGRSEDNHLRHVSEYLRYQRKARPLATSYPKEGLRRALRDKTERDRLLKECERRKARREVLHATGKSGARKRYTDRKPAGPAIDCKKFRH